MSPIDRRIDRRNADLLSQTFGCVVTWDRDGWTAQRGTSNGGVEKITAPSAALLRGRLTAIRDGGDARHSKAVQDCIDADEKFRSVLAAVLAH